MMLVLDGKLSEKSGRMAINFREEGARAIKEWIMAMYEERLALYAARS